MSPANRFALAALFASTLAWNATGLADDKPADKDLENFLEKLDDAKKPDTAKKGETAKPAAEVSGKDKDLDNFLEKLGETKEAPAPEEKRPGKPQPSDEPDHAPKPGKPAADPLKGKEKDFDKHLEELTGRKPKPKNDGDGNSPLSKVVKEMREVEERLGKPDTGEDTRKKQSQIVKDLDQLIEQIKNSKPSGKKKLQLVTVRGEQKPGKPEGEQPGAEGGKAPRGKTEKPTTKRSLAGGKDEWGHLPPELRQEMDNVFKEEGLPSKEDLIRRYYLSLSKKKLVREE